MFRVFGEEILVARTAVAVLHGAATAALFALTRSARSDGLAHVAGAVAACTPILLFPLFSTYFYTTLAVSIGVLASWAALCGLRDVRWTVVAGVLATCAALCKQTVGAVLAAGLLVSLIACAPPRARGRTALGLITGGVLVAGVTLTAFAVTGGFGSLVYSLIELPLSFEPSYNSPFMNFWPPGVFSEEIKDSQAFYLPYFYTLRYGVWRLKPGWAMTIITQILYALPFIAVVATLVRRRSGPLAAAVWIHLATLLAMASNLFPRAPAEGEVGEDDEGQRRRQGSQLEGDPRPLGDREQQPAPQRRREPLPRLAAAPGRVEALARALGQRAQRPARGLEEPSALGLAADPRHEAPQPARQGVEQREAEEEPGQPDEQRQHRHRVDASARLIGEGARGRQGTDHEARGGQGQRRQPHRLGGAPARRLLFGRRRRGGRRPCALAAAHGALPRDQLGHGAVAERREHSADAAVAPA